MTPKPKSVVYDLFNTLVCEEHLECGPLLCCPFPGCPNGIDSEEIEATSPRGRPEVYRRAVWTDADGEQSYSWEDDKLPRWFMIPRVLWREAMRKGLVGRAASANIYHYTTPEGLLGIIEKGELWMSDYSYLNDAVELTYGLQIAQERFRHAAQNLRSAAGVLCNWANTVATLDCRVCVASFSHDGDSLSQWRAYGPIAIGFRHDVLAFGYSNTVVSRPVIYDPETQCRLMDLMAHLCASAYAEDQERHPGKVRAIYEYGTDRVLDVTAFFKHPAFADEREVRMVHVENPRVFESLPLERAPHRFRAAKGLLIPYVTTRDVAHDYPERLPIYEVIIGPSRHAEVLQRGVEEFLSAHGYSSVQVRRSIAPLRS